tara:strand:+ start:218 stop:694 length:477 start_codon:yes stop_codon:yes gene_type:complete
MNGINILKNHYQKLTLINRKTGKVSSSHHWFLAIAANAYLQKHTRGISSLLPLSRAKKILKHNILAVKEKRPGQDETSRYLARQEAKLILPQLEILFRYNLKSHQKFLKKNFCLWIKQEINEPFTVVHQFAQDKNMLSIVEGHHSFRWWMDQLKKMQS